jgi:hypothetical protein
MSVIPGRRQWVRAQRVPIGGLKKARAEMTAKAWLFEIVDRKHEAKRFLHLAPLFAGRGRERSERVRGEALRRKARDLSGRKAFNAFADPRVTNRVQRTASPLTRSLR